MLTLIERKLSLLSSTYCNSRHQNHWISWYAHRFRSMCPDRQIESKSSDAVVQKPPVGRGIRDRSEDKRSFPVGRSIDDQMPKHSTTMRAELSLSFESVQRITFNICNFSRLRSNSNCWFRSIASALNRSKQWMARIE